MTMGRSIDDLISALRVLPGVGPKSAQRMVFHLLQHNRNGAEQLRGALAQALERVRGCERCRNLCDRGLCALCNDPRRAESGLCVVESPADVLAIESAGGFRGRYFVLHGRLSPIDGIGPDEIGVDALCDLVAQEQPGEIILATNPTVEGEATAHYLHAAIQNALPGVAVTRIAHGVPVGGELEFANSGTLGQALAARQQLKSQ